MRQTFQGISSPPAARMSHDETLTPVAQHATRRATMAMNHLRRYKVSARGPEGTGTGTGTGVGMVLGADTAGLPVQRQHGGLSSAMRLGSPIPHDADHLDLDHDHQDQDHHYDHTTMQDDDSGGSPSVRHRSLASSTSDSNEPASNHLEPEPGLIRGRAQSHQPPQPPERQGGKRKRTQAHAQAQADAQAQPAKLTQQAAAINNKKRKDAQLALLTDMNTRISEYIQLLDELDIVPGGGRGGGADADGRSERESYVDRWKQVVVTYEALVGASRQVVEQDLPEIRVTKNTWHTRKGEHLDLPLAYFLFVHARFSPSCPAFSDPSPTYSDWWNETKDRLQDLVLAASASSEASTTPPVSRVESTSVVETSDNFRRWGWIFSAEGEGSMGMSKWLK